VEVYCITVGGDEIQKGMGKNKDGFGMDLIIIAT
jgi:hypothetical protein